MGCQVTLFYYSSPTKPAAKGGDSMVNLIPVQLFSRLVTFSVADVKIGGDEVFLILILPHSDFSIVMCHGSTCGRWTEVDQSGILPHWKVFFKTFSAKEAYTVFHRNMTRFGLYVFKPALGKGAISAAGFDLPTQDCLTTIMQIDDNMDNDCDGNIDEEIENEEDDDGDGRVDEDLRIPSRSVVIHGVWSVWSPWDCWATCGGAARYRRYRYCDRPPPSAQGRDCPGDFVEYSNRICDYTNVPCFKDCPFTKWGPRCDEDCPTGCLHRTCDYDTGHCMGCRPGRMGDQCEMECPRFHFGAGCNQSCLEFCIDHCDPETGECDFDLKLMHVLVSILTMGIIPGVLFYAGIVLCKKQDPDLRALKDTLHSVDEQTNEVKLFTKARELNHKELRRRLKKKPSNWSAQIPAPVPVPEPEKPVGQKPGPDASFIKMAASAVEMVVKLPKGTSAGSVK
ncbi:hypothetical protein EGW08_009787 [Elysia chlorotica]|uniref:EGF-like domain-containing protein n=1 Tax=Elysia chlorotica TaxID=188477 RepID=A0A3S1A4B6_ELYCH|nr:hypothetical protein EGW08_009787 [Elysia chlorotica]